MEEKDYWEEEQDIIEDLGDDGWEEPAFEEEPMEESEEPEPEDPIWEEPEEPPFKELEPYPPPLPDPIKTEIPEFYEIIPEYNSAGRLCNHGSGNEAMVKVPADEFERFNRLAGRQHRIVDGLVIYDETLEICTPDASTTMDPITELQLAVIELYEEVLARG